MNRRFVIGLVFVMSVPARSPAEERPLLPAVQTVLAQRKYSGIQEFRRWRRDLIEALRKTIEDRVRQDNWRARGTETEIAMVWAGELRASELIPLLIRHIDFGVLEKEALPREDRYPSVRALILIGKASSVACVSALHLEQDPIRRQNMVLVIRRVEGDKPALLLIRKAMEEETDASKKANLEAALKLFSTRRAPK